MLSYLLGSSMPPLQSGKQTFPGEEGSRGDPAEDDAPSSPGACPGTKTPMRIVIGRETMIS